MFYLTSRIITSMAVFLYPGYASYKTLSQRPASEEDLERWLMYWSVLGCIVSVELLGEWVVAWVPFYYPIKTIFLLYLALPQTRGSSYLYIYHLQPFFHSHESEIDAALASLKARIYTFLRDRLRALWEHVSATIGQQQQAEFDPAGGITGANAGAQPTLGDPISGPAQLASSLWRSYGPGIITSGAAILRQSQSVASANADNARQPIPPAPVHTESSQSVLERRRQLEAELASLPPAEVNVPSLPIPPASPSFHQSRTSSESDLRERSLGSGKFEEIDVPSDVEGYDVDGSSSGGGGEGGRDDNGTPAEKPMPAKRTSWFGGWGGSPVQGNYERVKSD